MVNSNASASELWETTDSEDDTVDLSNDKSHGAHNLPKKGEDSKSSSDSENLSDIADTEVSCYLNSEKEKNCKKIIWEMMNKKYLQDQEAKKFAAASKLSNPKRKQIHKTAKDMKKGQFNAETAQEKMSKKRPSTRINYDALKTMFEDEPEEHDENPKRARTQSVTTKGQVKGPADDMKFGAVEESEDEQNGWEERPSNLHYDYQDEDYYYDGVDDDF